MLLQGDNEISNSNRPKVKSLYKALKLLEYFDAEHKEVGVTELAEYSGMLKSSVHNILQTFEQCGYVMQNCETQKYMLGGAVVSLFSRYKESRNLDYRITEYLQQLRDIYKNNVYLAEKEGDEAVYICCEQAFYFQKDYLSKAGAHVPLHCTSVGKVLLGYSTVKEKEEFYKKNIKPYTENTITDVGKLKKEMQDIIYRGYATGFEEYLYGRFCVAIPIITGEDAVKYSIGMSCLEPISDYMLKEYLRSLRDVGKKIAGILVS